MRTSTTSAAKPNVLIESSSLAMLELLPLTIKPSMRTHSRETRKTARPPGQRILREKNDYRKTVGAISLSDEKRTFENGFRGQPVIGLNTYNKSIQIQQSHRSNKIYFQLLITAHLLCKKNVVIDLGSTSAVNLSPLI